VDALGSQGFKVGPDYFQPPAPERVARFQEILWQQGYTVLLRQSRGRDIDAACGQLAGRYAQDAPAAASSVRLRS